MAEPMQRSGFRLLDRMRVRWAEIDAQQIVFNGHYLTYLDTAVAAWWRAMALPYAETMRALAGDLFVRKATLEYHAPARYDELLDVGIRCTRFGNSSMTLAGAVFRQDLLLVSAELVYVFADPVAQLARPLPQVLRSAIEAFEAGESMVALQVGKWSELGDAARALRAAVFIDEQHIAADLEWDSADADAVHAVAHNRLGRAVATGRLLNPSPGVARIGRMAVHAALRGEGIGAQVLHTLIAVARERGDHDLVLHAQLGAADFYRRAGFVERGPHFESAGIAHVEMARPL